MVSIFGTELRHVIIAIAIPFIPDAARIVRSNALSIRQIAYVDAARALGFSTGRIILRHMLPNVMAPYLVILTANIGQAILLEASLSYLGMGYRTHTRRGLMLQGGAENMPARPGLHFSWPRHYTIGIWIQSLRRRGRDTRRNCVSSKNYSASAPFGTIYYRRQPKRSTLKQSVFSWLKSITSMHQKTVIPHNNIPDLPFVRIDEF